MTTLQISHFSYISDALKYSMCRAEDSFHIDRVGVGGLLFL